MLHHLGILLQVAAMVLLPALVLWQLIFGFPLILMPILLVAGMAVFGIGTKLRESK